MQSLRNALQRLGWPIDLLSDEEIARELYDRWFICCGDPPEPVHTVSCAAARGIFAAMGSEGNLDALCWSEADDIGTLSDQALEAVRPIEERAPGDVERPEPDRRRSEREPVNDLVNFVAPSSKTSASGWLIDISAEGIAFIAETQHVPALGSQIIPAIQTRSGDNTELSSATVVRTELLTDALSLVCAQLVEAQDPTREPH